MGLSTVSLSDAGPTDARAPEQVASVPSSSGGRDSRDKPVKGVVSALSGAIAGSLISACVQPLDVVRTKMQGDAALGIRRTMFGTAAAVVRKGGVRGLWQGTGPSVLRVGLGAGMHFMLLEQAKLILSGALLPNGEVARLSALGAALAGGLSRAVAAAVLCPITVVKTRMEYCRPAGSTAAAALPVYRNTWHALVSISKLEGVPGLFKGLLPTILTNAPFSGLYYMFYTELKGRLSDPDRVPQTLVNFGSGLVAAVAASVLTQPADVVRTRMQLDLAGGRAHTAAALTAIFKAEGAAGLLTGVGPRVLKRTSQTALVWTLYEELVPRISSVMAWGMGRIAAGLPPHPAGSAGSAQQSMLTDTMRPISAEHDAPARMPALGQKPNSGGAQG